MTLKAPEQLGMQWKSKSCKVFIRSAPSFLELTYMLFQNNSINNGVTNERKQTKERKKTCKSTLHGKIKEGREIGVNF